MTRLAMDLLMVKVNACSSFAEFLTSLTFDKILLASGELEDAAETDVMTSELILIW